MKRDKYTGHRPKRGAASIAEAKRKREHYILREIREHGVWRVRPGLTSNPLYNAALRLETRGLIRYSTRADGYVLIPAPHSDSLRY